MKKAEACIIGDRFLGSQRIIRAGFFLFFIFLGVLVVPHLSFAATYTGYFTSNWAGDGFSGYYFNDGNIPIGTYYYQCSVSTSGYFLAITNIIWQDNFEYDADNVAGDWYTFTVTDSRGINSMVAFGPTGSLGANCTDGGNLTVTDTAPALGPSVAFALPLQDASMTPNFPYWDIDITNSSTSSVQSVDVLYGLSTSTMVRDDSGPLLPIGGGPEEAQVPLSTVLWNPPMAIPEEWYAQAIYSVGGGGGTTTYLSSIISFFVDPNLSLASSTPLLPIGGETSSTLLGATTNCVEPTSSVFSITGSVPFFSIANPDPYVSYAICSAGSYLFIPNSAEQYNMGVLFNAAVPKTKPPFGWIAPMVADFTGLSDSSSSRMFSLDTAILANGVFSGLFNTIDLALAAVLAFIGLIIGYHYAKNQQI